VSFQTSKEQTVAAAIMDVERVLIGQDPTRIEAIWNDL
jgi:galactonate dehydratase